MRACRVSRRASGCAPAIGSGYANDDAPHARAAESNAANEPLAGTDDMPRRRVRGRFVIVVIFAIQVGDDGAPRVSRPENTKNISGTYEKALQRKFRRQGLSGKVLRTTMDRLRPRRHAGAVHQRCMWLTTLCGN